MALADVHPLVRSLSHEDQVELMHHLIDEVAQRCRMNSDLLEKLLAGCRFEIYTPEPCFEAAAILEKFLADEQARTK